MFTVDYLLFCILFRYDNVKLPIGKHKFFRVVLEGFDYESEPTPTQMGESSKTVREAIVSERMNAYSPY